MEQPGTQEVLRPPKPPNVGTSRVDSSPGPSFVVTHSPGFAYTISEANPSDRPSIGPPGRIETVERVENDLAWYVPPQLQQDFYGTDVSCIPHTTWHNHPMLSEMQTLNPDYGRYGIIEGPEGNLSVPATNISPLDVSYPSLFPNVPHATWNNTEEHRSEHMEPG
jgi:hypothetical protein